MNYVGSVIMCIYVLLNTELFYKHIYAFNCVVTYSKRVKIPYKQGALSHINTAL